MEQKNKKCIKAMLMATKKEGPYKIYVFENVKTGEFIFCTRCPNWRGKEPEVLQQGFLEYKDVEAGLDQYYDNVDATFRRYGYSATYFQDFVPITHVLNNGYVVEKDLLKVS